MQTKENDFSRVMIPKTIEELQEYISFNNKFQDDAVIAAIWELQNRGFEIEGAETLLAELTAENNKNIGEKSVGLTPNTSKPSISKDAPELYHPRFILIFGTLFSVLGSGIILALNFKRLGKKDLIIPTIAVSFIFVLVQSFLISTFNITNPGLTIVSSVLGVYLLEVLFWNKNVDSKIGFKNRSVWPPIIIGVLVSIPIFIYLYYTGQFDTALTAE